MTDLLARLRIEATAADTPAVAARVKGALKGVGDEAIRTNTALGGVEAGATRAATGLDRAGDQAQRFEQRARGGASGATMLTAALSAAGIAAFTREISNAAFAAGGLELGLGAVAGGSANARAELAFVRQEAGRLGLVVQATSKDFLDLAASTNGTAIAGENTRQIWLATAEAGMALGRSPEQIGRGLTALSQIAGKGVVSMEEVRQQLAEAIPGAAVIGARALNMTSAEFTKLVESGELTAERFLPAFAAQLREEFGPAIDAYLTSPLGRARQEIGQFQTSVNDLKAAAGEGFLTGMTDGLARLNDQLGDGDTAAQARELGESLGESAAMAAGAMADLVENIEAVQAAAGLLIGVGLARYLGPVATAAYASASGLLATGSASAVARAGLTGLMGLVGGPFGAAFLAAGAAVWVVNDAIQQNREDMAELRAGAAETEAYLKQLEAGAAGAGGAIGAMGSESRDALAPIAAMTGETHRLADATFRLAASRKEAELAELMQQRSQLQARSVLIADRRRENASNDAMLLGAVSGGMAGFNLGAQPTNRPALNGTGNPGQLDREQRQLDGQTRRLDSIIEDVVNRRPLDGWDQETPANGAGGGGGSGSRGRDRVGDMAEDLEHENAALEAHIRAVQQGEAALDAWRIAQAGADAVLRAGSESVRAQAEAVERLAIADERIEQGAAFARSADRDREALIRRAAAAAAGREALEALRVTEAGLAQLQAARVTSLDQLEGAERQAVALAVAAAEAKERQAIATEKAEAAGQSVEQLGEEIAAEERRQASIGRGIAAEVAYARAEFIRQEVERAGLQVTDEAARAIMEKADALFTLQAVTDGRQQAADQERELRLMRLTNRERDLAVRAETILRSLQAERVAGSAEELAAMADRRAQLELEAEETAEAIGRISSSLREEFVRSGSLGIDELADYAEEQLRAALYDAFLAEPIRIVVEATVDIVNDLARQIFGGSAAKGFLSQITGGMGLPGGIGSLLGSAGVGALMGSSLGLGSGNGWVDAGLSVGGAALGGMAGGALTSFASFSSMVGGGMLSSIAGLLGPVMGPLGALAGLALGSLFKDEKRPYTRADIVAQGGRFVVAGTQTADGATSEVADQLGKAITESLNAATKLFGIDVAKLEGLYTTAGFVDGGNFKALGGKGFFGGDIRGLIDYFNQAGGDLKGNTLGAGVSFTQIGDAEDLAEAVVRETILRAIAAGASDLTEAEASLVAASESLEEAITLIETARGFGDRLDDMLMELLDPAGFEKKKAIDQVEATYAALKAEAEQLIGAGLLSAETLDKIERLRDLQLEEAINGAANDNAAQGPFSQARERLQGWLDSLMVSDVAPGGARQQRDMALDQYQRVLALAQGGNREAIAEITTYADRLLRADRQATGSSTQREALFNQVTADVTALMRLAATEEPLNAAAIAGPIVAALAASDTTLADVLLQLPPETAGPLLEAILREPDWAERLLGDNVEIPPALQELRDRVMLVGSEASGPIVQAVMATPAWVATTNSYVSGITPSVERVAELLKGLPPGLTVPIIQALSLTPGWGTSTVEYLKTLPPSLELLQEITKGLPPNISGPIVEALLKTPGWLDGAVEHLKKLTPSLTTLQDITRGLPPSITGPVVEALLKTPGWSETLLSNLKSLLEDPEWARLIQQALGTDLKLSFDDLDEVLERLLALLSAPPPATNPGKDGGPQINPGPGDGWTPPVTGGGGELPPIVGGGGGGDQPPIVTDDGTVEDMNDWLWRWYNDRGSITGRGGGTSVDPVELQQYAFGGETLSGGKGGSKAIADLGRTLEDRLGQLQTALEGVLGEQTDVLDEGLSGLLANSAEQLQAAADAASAARVTAAHLIAKKAA